MVYEGTPLRNVTIPGKRRYPAGDLVERLLGRLPSTVRYLLPAPVYDLLKTAVVRSPAGEAGRVRHTPEVFACGSRSSKEGFGRAPLRRPRRRRVMSWLLDQSARLQ